MPVFMLQTLFKRVNGKCQNNTVPTAIKISIGEIQLKASLNDSPTALAIIENLPIKSSGQRWGDEIYFSINVQADLEPDASDVLQPGDLAFWPSGNAFCIFWGPTPASIGNEVRAASPVNLIGSIEDDLTLLARVNSHTPVRIEKS